MISVNKYLVLEDEDEGIRVTFIRKTESSILMKIEGIKHPWADKVMKYSLDKGGQAYKFFCKHEGSDWQVLTIHPSKGSQNPLEQCHSLFLPGEKKFYLNINLEKTIEANINPPFK